MRELETFIQEMDYILVGIGEEFEQKAILTEDKHIKLYEEIKKANNEWALPYVNTRLLKDKSKNLMDAYNNLYKLLDGKNYFIVSTCMNGYLKESSLNKERIVEPCGSYTKMQCINNCGEELEETDVYVLRQIEEFCDKYKWSPLNLKRCKKCGEVQTFNNIYLEKYREEGYINQWEKYTKWLQNTLNRNVCIIELGVGMMYPSVIRWPFEKVAFYNKKAKFVRVNETLYQMTEELAEKGYSIPQNSVSALAKM